MTMRKTQPSKMKRFPLFRVLLVGFMIGLAVWICFPSSFRFLTANDDDGLVFGTPSPPPVPIDDPDYPYEKPDFGFDPASLSVYDQKDPRLAKLVQQHYITEPSKSDYGSYGLRAGASDPMKVIWPILGQTVGEGKGKKGFFVEAGFPDGINASKTLWLEQELGWSGLLVDCNPEVLSQLRRAHRKVYIASVCLSPHKHPALTKLLFTNGLKRPLPTLPSSRRTSKGEEPYLKSLLNDIKIKLDYRVKTVPLYSLLAAVNVTTVGLVSLDIHGVEYKVLTHFPFDKILVKSWLIETGFMSAEVKASLTKLMVQNGYLGPMPAGESGQLFVLKTAAPLNFIHAQQPSAS